MCRQISCVDYCFEQKMSDSYPEYLNPFAEDIKPKKKLTIRNSFKEIKRTFRQSFRIKKRDDEVTLRQKTDTLPRLPMSYSGPPQQTEALPRSRFHERVSRTIPGSNPFEDEEDEREKRISMTRRRAKKRAPPPPKSLSSQNINDGLETPASGSHWSLTSIDTDCSVLTDNFVPEEQDSKMVETFRDFTKNMESLKDDTNNNVITKEEIESSNQIPDLVVSCPSDTNNSLDDDEKKSSDEEQAEEEKLNVSGDEDTELVIKDITNNLIVEDRSDKVVENGNDEEPFLYHQDKNLYIAGSKDQLNESDTHMGRVSLYITGSHDDLDASNNNEVCTKSVIDENSSDDAVPIPKQRKNKLTKDILLGV